MLSLFLHKQKPFTTLSREAICCSIKKSITSSKMWRQQLRFLSLSSSVYLQNSPLIKSPCQLEASHLKSRSLIRLGGVDTKPFLQGLITNDLLHLETRPSLYTLLLNHQGRLLYDAVLYALPDKKTLLLECDASLKNKLISHLKLFRVKKAVDIIAEEELSVWVVYDPAHHKYVVPSSDPPSPVFNLTDNCCAPLTHYSSKREPLPFSPPPAALHFGDPRLPELGWRVLVGGAQPFPSEVKVKESEDGYKKLRYALGVAEGASELPHGNSFPLESNGDFLHGISFQKGCYIGQELTARTHHTGVIRKRIMPFRLEEGVHVEGDLNNLQILNEKERPVGKVRGLLGSSGIALVRVEEVLSASELRIGSASVTISRPLWWPIEAAKELSSKK